MDLVNWDIMNENTKFKAIVLTNSLTLKMLKADIDNADIELIGVSKESEFISYLQSEHFDIVLIDNLYKEAENICYSVCEIAPIAILVREAEVDWHKLMTWEADGFVSEDCGRTEFITRIKAISRSRRKSPGLIKSK